jgi:bifunctional non-homologous end joining protein LigD
VGLAEYRRKRRLGRTPEPASGRTSARGPLRFVVQKHHARRLHYDFRLELDGVLVSWAVPKGPSLDPADRRLAVRVEDHPLDYRSFEGVIPAGHYGAGRVIVWDRGTYRADGATTRKESEKALRAGLRSGRLDVELSGKKLRGRFLLVKTRRASGKDWLLIKRSDAHATAADVTTDDRSVVTGHRLADVGVRKRRHRAIVVRGAPEAPFPRDVRPMLATLADRPFDRHGWVFEVKWDGYRAIAEVEAGSVRLYSRTGKSFAARFPAVAEAVAGLGHDAVIDGEIVALDESGHPQFQFLQDHARTPRGRLVYVVFDLLHLDGRDLRELPLLRRKEYLARLVRGVPGLLLSEHVAERGIDFFRVTADRGLEGVIAKDGHGKYRPGVRTRDWLKVKARKRQEAVIAGFTAPRGSRTGLGALVLGVYRDGELNYIGHTGGGFDARSLAAVRARLEPLRRKTCPFPEVPRTNAPATWVRPELVCEVEFQEWTADGRMRQPIFLGLRDDKPPTAIRREEPVHASGKTVPEPPPSLTNLDKVYWPDEGYTKGNLIEYYRTIAPVMLPYLRDRPLSLHRHPDGIAGKSFFQKDVGRLALPAGVETAELTTDDGRPVRYLVGGTEAALLYAANLGCIEINPWNARAGSPDRPDYLAIDLDPQDVPFAAVVEAALAVRRVLDRAGAESACKTSGKRGLHVYVPLGARYPTDQARQFAELIARVVHERLPATTSVVRSPALRRRRVYLDYLQNRPGQNLAAG